MLRTLGLVGLLLWLTGCALRPPVLAPELAGGAEAPAVELTATPFFPQEQYQCGPAALATVLRSNGVATTPQALVPEVYLPARQGSLQTEMVAAVRRAGRLPYPLEPRLEALLAELRAGRPVLVFENLGLNIYPIWHYAVLVGYRPASDELVLRSGVEERRVVSARRFLASWERGGRWALVVLRPDELPAEPDPRRYLQAAADLEATGQPQAAGSAYRTALRQWPDDATAWLGLGNSEYALGHRAAAERAYRELLARHPRHLAGHNNLAQVLADRGCRRAALRLLDAALAEAPEEDPLRAELERSRASIAAYAQSRNGNSAGDSCR